MNKLFISDLHLSPDRSQIISLFNRFTREVAINYQQLYILGDFLEYWLGDDDKAIGLESAFDALNQLAASGVDIFFMHGNRDFLVGDKLAERCQFKIIDDPYTDIINGEKTLLMHGDTLCTDDTQYQEFRKIVRNKNWQKEQLAKPLSEREKLARSFREQSQVASADKLPEIMDVNNDTVANTLLKYGSSLLIHGHTHRPAIHTLDLNGKQARRIVLGDWYKNGSYLSATSDKLELLTF